MCLSPPRMVLVSGYLSVSAPRQSCSKRHQAFSGLGIISPTEVRQGSPQREKVQTSEIDLVMPGFILLLA